MLYLALEAGKARRAPEAEVAGLLQTCNEVLRAAPSLGNMDAELAKVKQALEAAASTTT